jgi:DnaB-like helicase N terminal domain
MVATNDRTMTSNDPDRPPVRAEAIDDCDEMSVPPHSGQAEEAVLGAVLKNGLAIADVVPFLKPRHFYEARNRYIYAAMAALFDRASAIDYHTIAEELERQGTYQQAGGLVYLSEVNLVNAIRGAYRALCSHRPRARGQATLHRRCTAGR